LATTNTTTNKGKTVAYGLI